MNYENENNKGVLDYALFIQENITAFKDSEMSFIDLLNSITSTKILINDDYLVYHYFKYNNSNEINSEIINNCYLEINKLDNNYEMLEHFRRTLSYFETLINFEPAIDFKTKYFKIEDNKLKSVCELFIFDPWNEDDEGVEIIIYEGYDKKLIYNLIESFFDDMFEKYFKKIMSIYNKKLSNLSKKEKKIIHMLLI